jgi:talin
LTHVKRWTASPNTFTLDFGDYASAYYSVQTHEGQQISQLIAGYIDIILKKVVFFFFVNLFIKVC